MKAGTYRLAIKWAFIVTPFVILPFLAILIHVIWSRTPRQIAETHIHAIERFTARSKEPVAIETLSLWRSSGKPSDGVWVDPFGGGLLKLRQRGDCILVYSISEDFRDSGGRGDDIAVCLPTRGGEKQVTKAHL